MFKGGKRIPNQLGHACGVSSLQARVRAACSLLTLGVGVLADSQDEGEALEVRVSGHRGDLQCAIWQGGSGAAGVRGGGA